MWRRVTWQIVNRLVKYMPVRGSCQWGSRDMVPGPFCQGRRRVATKKMAAFTAGMARAATRPNAKLEEDTEGEPDSMLIPRKGKRTRLKVLVAALVVAAGLLATTWVTGRGGFDLSTHSVPSEQIMDGGPGKDGIPAILAPQFVPASQADFLKGDDRVLALSRGKEAKAYPIKILNWHEVVNDRFDGRPVVITYCPLCGTGIAFDATIGNDTYTFGVSGLLYQSDLLMYDHQTESLWSQISMEAVAGPLTGSRLEPIYLVHTTWGEWIGEHPKSPVLSTQTGYLRDYSRDPYEGYAQRRDLMFDVTHFDPTYHPKAWVVGVEIDGVSKAYAFSELDRAKSPVRDHVNGQALLIHFSRRATSATVSDEHGNPIPSVMAYWFAWHAFHPDTAIFRAP